MRLPLLALATLLAAPTTQAATATECAVWNRELSFAQSVADHDATAFAEHLLPDATFVGGNGQPTSGRDAIVREWTGLIAGTGAVLQWYPDAVHVAADGRVALSRGPYWMQFTGEDGEPRRLAGRFISTWLRGDDGTWHVAFDGGGGHVPRPITGTFSPVAGMARVTNVPLDSGGDATTAGPAGASRLHAASGASAAPAAARVAAARNSRRSVMACPPGHARL